MDLSTPTVLWLLGCLVGDAITLHGVTVSGLGKAAGFMELVWVREELARKLDLEAYPGTFNVRLTEPASLMRWHALAEQPGIAIEPPNSSACVARCYPVQVNDRLSGAIILPHVANYPPDQVEVMSAVCVRRELRLADGDPVTLRLVEPTS